MNININIDEIHVSELTEWQNKLLKQATAALENAYAPYSDFKVGAAVLLEDGTIIVGNNQENIAFPSGLCAERVALFSAVSNHKGRTIKAILITTSNNESQIPITPCGACRQVISEYEKLNGKSIQIIMHSPSGSVLIAQSASDLLPLAFNFKF